MSPADRAAHARRDAEPGYGPAREEMLADVLSGLAGSPRTLPAKYFYDEAGSRLFDEITRLDEYYLTRTETAILRSRAPEIARAVGPRALLIEPGAGSSAKTRLLLDHLSDPAGYVPIDISGEYLEAAAEALRADHPDLWIRPVVGDFTRLSELPVRPPPAARRVVYFPGSTIGNFGVLESVGLLRRMRRLVGPGGAVLIGFDLVKSREVLRAAYDDARGVTARFNLNVLRRINRELGADFDLEAFEHVAPFNEEASRIEMHLVSRREQTVRVAGHAFRLEAGEPIVTEYSHKYTLESFAELARLAGLRATRTWSDALDWFSVQLLEPSP